MEMLRVCVKRKAAQAVVVVRVRRVVVMVVDV
jgi:hypothetical protein